MSVWLRESWEVITVGVYEGEGERIWGVRVESQILLVL